MKKAVLEALKNSIEHYVSGEELSQTLGVSRTMVWKIIKNLREEGYIIESSSRKGYQLLENKDYLSQAELELILKKQEWISKGYFFESIDSTNTYGKKLALETLEAPLLIVANEQTAGRGRLGRQWYSKSGDGLWMSLILRPNISPQESFTTTLIAAVAVAKAIRNLYGLEAGIKWPNDIIVNRQKICGILSEMSIEWQTVNYIVVGIGINANHDSFPEDIQHIATSLKLQTGALIERHRLLNEILEQFGYYFKAFTDDVIYEELINQYRQYSVTIGHRVRVIGKEEKVGQALDINKAGELRVQFDDGTVEDVYHGEVSVRGLDYYV